MAGRINPDTKARLIAAGVWQDFLDHRKELQANGFRPGDATARALSEYAGPKGPPVKKRVTTPKGGALPPLAEAPEGLDEIAAEPEVVRWVARNIDNPEPKPSECPDPFAWTLLRRCRASDGFTDWFIDKLWSKLIPSRANLDSGTSGELDGKVTMDMIERIQAIRDQAVLDAALPLTETMNDDETPDPEEEE